MELRTKSFVRRKGKGFSQSKQQAIDDILPEYLFKISELPNLTNYLKVCFEIGFGNGDYIASHALKYPQDFFIGAETYVSGVANLVKAIKKENIKNIRIWHEDARILIEKMQDDILDEITILFPDPWPKQKQQHRRLINQQLVDMIASKLKLNGNAVIASDDENYVTNILEYFVMHPQFLWQVSNKRDWLKAGDVETKYFKRANKLNNVSYFLKFKKIANSEFLV